MELNHLDPLPLHAQLRNMLEYRIQQGKYDEKIPSERELMDEFQVSRATVREAVISLVNDGFLDKKHGKGTFVRKLPPVQDWIDKLNSLTETVRETGLTPGSKLLKIDADHKDKKASAVLQVEKLYFIERLRYASAQPIAIEQHYYPADIGTKLATFDLNEAVIYDLLENELGLFFYETDEVITCKLASIKEAELLKVKVGESLLVMERTLYDQTGRIIECLNSVYRPDLFTFRIKRKRFQ